jgi:pimeloyl-ACP methyl ester carboxylesterase
MKNRGVTLRLGLFLVAFLLVTSSASAVNEVRIECPVVSPTAVAGDSIAIKVHITNDVNLGAFVLGFHYNSDMVEITSVLKGPVIPTGTTFKKTFVPLSNQVLIGYVDMSGGDAPIIPQTDGLAFTLYMKLLPGVTAHCVDIDSTYIPPAGPFIFSPVAGYMIRPAYVDCGICDVVIPSPPPIVPVVLVHGWNHDPDIWNLMKSWLIADGHYVYEAMLNDCGDPEEWEAFGSFGVLRTEKMFRGNANALGIQIAGYIASLPQDVQNRVSQVDIIAHSMGGLISRRYLNPKSGDNWPHTGVRNLIMLGTPNNGAEAAGWGALLKCLGPASKELDPVLMKAFNKEFPYEVPAGTQRFVVYGGGACPVCITINNCERFYHLLSCLLFLSCPNDGLVTRSSAVGQHSFWDLTPPFYHVEDAYEQNWEAGTLCHSDLYRDPTIYNSYIKQILLGNLPSVNRPSAQETNSLESRIAYFSTGVAEPGQTLSGSFYVEPNNFIAVALLSPEPNLAFKITSPSSVVYDSASTSPDSTVIWLSDYSGSSGFQIESAETGNWQWQIEATTIDSLCAFSVLASYNNDIVVFGSQNVDYPLDGDTLILNVSISENGLPLTGLTVSALEVWNDSDTLSSVTFIDDGIHNDSLANDGIYGAVIVSFGSRTGIVRYHTIITGSTALGPINRYLQFSAYIQSFLCGDANGDDAVDISDAVSLIAYIFSGGPAPNPLASGDANSDGAVDISDVVYLITYIFSGGLAPCSAF